MLGVGRSRLVVLKFEYVSEALGDLVGMQTARLHPQNVCITKPGAWEFAFLTSCNFADF